MFDINAALALIAAAPRAPQPLNVTAWANAYGLRHLDNPNPWATNLIGPTKNSLNRAYAMTADLTTPVIVCQIPITEQQPAPLLIDGTHRVYRAWRDQVPQLPAHLLTPAETQQIKTPR
ncbi:hypothetical protein AB0J14_25555 [Micromonospora arborensis]|uniref:hypothetical protein n=1 Tax=Micromonospora arborensis TaxID=2116518 RepID=UPI00340A0739